MSSIFTEPDSDLSVPRSGLHPGCQAQAQDYDDDAPQSLHASCIILPVPVLSSLSLCVEFTVDCDAELLSLVDMSRQDWQTHCVMT